MTDKLIDNFINMFGEKGKGILAGSPHVLSDEELANVAGGVGGAGEGTCWYCGKPAESNDSMWFCKDCHKGTSLDDAQTIALYKMVEEQYGKEYILSNGSYPVWWDLVVK